jgi:soluble lytic murein transglycosylase-like protein
MDRPRIDLSNVSQQLIEARRLELGGWLRGSQVNASQSSSGTSFADTLINALNGHSPVVQLGSSQAGGLLPPSTPYRELIESTAAEHGIPSALIAAIIQAESGFNANAISPAGAKGLMQLMDGTAAGLSVSDPFDPAQNIAGGAQYITSMLERYDGSVALALAAYNAGPGAVDQYGGIPPYAETQNYVPTVLRLFEQYRS